MNTPAELRKICETVGALPTVVYILGDHYAGYLVNGGFIESDCSGKTRP